jgi:hypothetical protein
MMNGFLEFGVTALAAFVFVNILAAWIFTDTNVPQAEEKVRTRRKFEEGVPISGAKLVTPEIKKQTPVG